MLAGPERFQSENASILARYYEELQLGKDASAERTPEAQAGHDFWLTRNSSMTRLAPVLETILKKSWLASNGTIWLRRTPARQVGRCR
jgi:hypothetical protein